jgi:hypothetical protein
VKERNLYLRVQEEERLYVADFFTEDGTFVADWAASKGDVTNLEELVAACEAYAFFL